MKPSLKRKLYWHVFLVAALIILSNRFATQTLLLGQLKETGLQEMGAALLKCEPVLGDPNQFRLCAQGLDPSRVTSVLTHGYQVCAGAPVASTESDSVCQKLLDIRAQWQLHERDQVEQVDVLHAIVQGEAWWGVRRTQQLNGPLVWLAESSITRLRSDLWSIRDRNLGYALPVILAMLGVLTLSIVYLVMRPIRLLESTLASLTSSNLSQTSNLQAPYAEFERIVQVFEDLRSRLSDSFLKARRFAADASHELRTPLTILRGNVEQLIHDLPLGSEHQVRMRMVSEEVERLVDITEKLLLLSRADGNSMVKDESEFLISEFLDELVSDAHLFHPELQMRSQIQPDVSCICDQRLIQQLIYNLYSNAVKYNVAEGWIRLDLQATPEQLVLDIENPSEDIPPQLSQLAFDRFYRGNAAHSRKVDGLGLGLSLCQEIARLHDAQLTLTTTENSTVLLRLVMPVHVKS